MSTIYQIILIGTLTLVVIQLGIVYMLARFIGNFINEIRSYRGIRIGGLEVGDEAPIFRELDHQKKSVSLKRLISEKNVVLLFISTKCPTCKELLTQLKKITEAYNVHFVLINNDKESDDREIVKMIPKGVFYIRSTQIGYIYFIDRVPTALIINQAGIIEKQNAINSVGGLWNILLNEERIAS